MISLPTPHPSSNFTQIPMDSNRPSPRQLQGPRPAPLKVRKDSYKINKKPPTIPQNPNPPPPKPNQPPRAPVIIYTVSPKIIHTNPSDFMTLVQRLTGPDSVPFPSPSAGAHSPAARFAAIETADKFSPRSSAQQQQLRAEEFGYAAAAAAAAAEGEALLDRSGVPGILSPLPSSLQPVSASFFSPIASFDPGSFGFLHDLSPGHNAGFFFSPHNLLATPTVPSPGAAWDLFNQF